MDRHKNLKELEKNFTVSTVLMITVLTLMAGLLKYEAGCRTTLSTLGQANTNLARMQENTASIKNTISSVTALIPWSMADKSHEFMIYAKLDDIKSQLRNADLSTSGIAETPEEYRLPFTIKLINPDYTFFINSLNRLQSSMLPAVIIKSIHIAQGSDQINPVVTITLEGAVSIPKQPIFTRQEMLTKHEI